MIGTTSVEESSEEILYPSISVCSLRKHRYHSFKTQNLSLFHRALNLSELIVSVELWYKNESGEVHKMHIDPSYDNLEDRDKKLF